MTFPAATVQDEPSTVWHKTDDVPPAHGQSARVRAPYGAEHYSMGVLTWHGTLGIWFDPATGYWWFSDQKEWAEMPAQEEVEAGD